ncbi:uncharacterized protein LOC127788128 [Diospyros lotus]|uniref:uncharacterized protein LOC127788128 n=1 Tax=Diospyros lotus TaxID=55363 RepID=UPI00224CB533|nr:uncharacterized protein LOC127788128 [Diospyros lotus]
MDMQTTNSLVKCHVFPITLGDIPRAWFRSLSPRNIHNWEECQRRFLKKYKALRRQLPPPCHLATVFQRANESLKDYITRFRHKVSNVEDPSDKSVLPAISMGLRKDGKLYESIYRTPIRDLGEFYGQAAKEVRWEEAFSLKKSTGPKEEAEGSN